MADFQPVDPTEAHPTRDEYVIERALTDGRWVVESIHPHNTPEAAETERARLLDCGMYQTRTATFRTVRRTITSTVIAVRPEGDQA